MRGPMPPRRDDERGQHDQRQQREPPLQPEHDREHDREVDDVRHDGAERRRDGLLRTDHVVVQADCSAPVCVRVKNASGMRCTWSNSATRRS